MTNLEWTQKPGGVPYWTAQCGSERLSLWFYSCVYYATTETRTTNREPGVKLRATESEAAMREAEELFAGSDEDDDDWWLLRFEDFA